MNHPLLRSSVLALILVLGLSGASVQSSAGARVQPAPAAIGPAAVIPAAGACFSAALSGTSEVPPNDSAVTGYATVVLAPSQQSITAYISYTGELSGTETAAHFHLGAPGLAGPVVYPLPAGNPKTLTQTLTLSDTSELLAGNLYVNIHSTGFGDGEIRGQINPASTCFSATLSGAEEVPPTGSTASGYGRFMLSADRTLLSYNIQTTGVISETMAHIHTAFVGTNGPVSIPLPLGATKVGTATLTLTNTAALLTGQFYVNVHTEDNQDGDIRGQIGADACQQLLPVIIRADAGPVLANGQTP